MLVDRKFHLDVFSDGTVRRYLAVSFPVLLVDRFKLGDVVYTYL